MGLPNLAEPPPQDHADWWGEYWFMNYQHHLQIQEAIYADSSGSDNQEIYAIIPWNPGAATGVLLNHQFMHNAMNAVTGYGGQDLTSLNFKDRSSVEQWVYDHYQEHLAADAFLNLGAS